MGYALFKAKSSKKIKNGFSVDDESAEGICSQYVNLFNTLALLFAIEMKLTSLSAK